jgi:hypothetical protein
VICSDHLWGAPTACVRPQASGRYGYCQPVGGSPEHNINAEVRAPARFVPATFNLRTPSLASADQHHALACAAA